MQTINSVLRWIGYAIAVLLILAVLGAIAGLFQSNNATGNNSVNTYHTSDKLATNAQQQPVIIAPPAPTATPLPGYIVEATKTALNNQATAAAMGLDSNNTAIQATATALQQEIAAQQLDLQQKEASYQQSQSTSGFWAWVWPVALVIVLLLVAGAGFVGINRLWLGGKLELIEAQARVATLLPDPNGNYPARITASGDVVTITPGNPSSFAPAPHTFAPHYAPHIISKAAPEAALQLPENIVDGEIVQPVEPITAAEALTLIPRNQLTWLFGTDEAGKPAIATIKDSVHTLNVGSTGQGKTTLTADLLLQLVKGNDAELYNLIIADIKGTLAEPFKPYAFATGTNPDDYVTLMAMARETVEQRRVNGETLAKGAKVWVIVVEEALALKKYLSKEQLDEYSKHLDIVALVGREYGVFLLACSQVDYSSKGFQDSRGQFMTRLGAAIMPTAANSMGFVNTKLVKRLWQERRPGQFLLEGPDGDRIIRAPLLDLKTDELPKLLNAGTQFQTDFKPASKVWLPETTLQPVGNHFATETKPIATATQSVKLVKPELTPEEMRILQLFRADKSVAEIVREIYGVSNGAKYQTRSAEVQAIIRKALS